ncbi:hypothetical protein AMECASPLE_025031 [Ameca splendens]|uniref:Fringe-like glycosyltransferase domain-containing protein n=1 Tax=Ameca splendens TaxID=208324 RepID=A0ABV0Y4J7_9TELE
MHIASVGVSKSCFLFSLAFCSLLLLFIPALQSPTQQLDPPQPRPQNKSAPARQSNHAKLPGGTIGAGGTNLAAGLSKTSEVQRTPVRTESPSPKRAVEVKISGSRPTDRLELKDIFIAVKTTRKYHRSRLELLIQTWVSQAKEQTYIFTDGEDKELHKKTATNIINTNCSAAHNRQALCCKMSVEYDKFIESQKK